MSALTFRSAWRGISARIRGLESAAKVHAGFLAIHSGSPYGADKALQQHCSAIYVSILEFKSAFGGAISAAALSAIDRFSADAGKQIGDNGLGDALLVRTIIVKLVAFESEMSFHLDAPLERIRSASELAFMHLQRLIVADGDYRAKWQAAFNTHETHCEALGSLHLLWHGIWSFKVNAEGGRTDLVYQEPLQIGEAPLLLGLVLTEWKLDKGDPIFSFAEARRQAKNYSGGILAGIELASHRFLILVSKKQIACPADVIEGGVIYRHINIAVDPSVPSVAARTI